MAQQINITANGDSPVHINTGHVFSVAVSGTLDGTIKVQYATADAVAAALTTSLTGSNNDLVFTAKNAGTAGNSLTVAYIDPSASDAALSLDFTYPDLVVNLATDSGDAATVTLEPTGDDNDIDITAIAAGATGNGYSVELLDPSANDSPLSVTTSDYLLFSVNLETDSEGAIVSTAAEVIAALTAYAPFAALMTADNTAANDGSGVVEAIAEAALTGGGANYAITTTAAEIDAAIDLDDSISRHLTAANASSNDGSGVVIVLTETALSVGTAGTFADYDGGDTGDFSTAGELVLVNVGLTNTINLNASGITTTDADVIVCDLGRY
jgi:hypothetical protein